MRIAFAAALFATALSPAPAARPARSAAIELWSGGETAFGIFAPNEKPMPRGSGEAPPAVYTRAGGAKLAGQALYDFLFLNLEPRYDAGAIAAMAEGLRAGASAPRKTLIVRIPTIERDGADAARTRIREAFALGADGVTVPHVRSLEEAKQVVGFFREAKVNIWSPANPGGDRIAMLMIEDPGALAQAAAIADLPGYSVLACGIGSLTQALGGNREAAEAGNQKILAETRRVGLVNMLTSSARDVEQRVAQGYQALIAIGPDVDVVIVAGRRAAGRAR